ncbi:hypothetical protein BDV59DRAFT_153305 [Aspergillus ambiguus]|uniref:putative Rad51 family DNA repair protein n=1 Tax=Aspergillus ambiguus TaxID=176160 RepID=UPI003CCCCD06
MAATLGERLLGEVAEEGLDEILRDLRDWSDGTSVSFRNASTGLKEIDKLLDVFAPMQHPTSAQTHGQATLPEDPVSCQEPQEGDQHGPTMPSTEHKPLTRGKNPVIEFSSLASGAGKSQLLGLLTAMAVLPSRWDQYQLDGRESAVVLIDTDGRLDVERLRVIAQGIIRRQLPDQDSIESPEIDTIISTSLQHLHVFRPQSSASLLATLQQLDAYLLDLPRHFSSTRPLHAIVVDSASAFFWQDKLHDEVARVEDIGRSYADIEHDRHHKKSFYLSEMYADLVAELKRLQRRFDCAIIYTTASWSGRSAPPAGLGDPNPGPFTLYDPHLSMSRFPSCRPSLPAPWGTFPTVRFLVRREAVRPFPPAMTVAEAQGDAAMRHGVVLRGRFSAWVNGWGCEDWPRRVLDRLDQMGWGMFTFNVRRDGVHVD